jgi:hypothetical protein
MATKVRVQKRLYYKIGDACKTLGIQPYVLRYWETEFPALSPAKSRPGSGLQREGELEIIRRIKQLLRRGVHDRRRHKKLEAELESGAFPDEGREGCPGAGREAGRQGQPNSTGRRPARRNPGRA